MNAESSIGQFILISHMLSITWGIISPGGKLDEKAVH